MDAQTLALYLGCECKIISGQYKDYFGAVRSVDIGASDSVMVSDCSYQNKISKWEDIPVNHTQVRLILRPLSSMTEEEKEKLAKIVEPKAHKWNVNIHFTGAITIETWGSHHSILDNYSPNTFLYLLSKSFDLFGLIEKGEAIDSTLTP